MTKQLPKYWVIKRDGTNPLWEKFKEWGIKNYNPRANFNEWDYFSNDTYIPNHLNGGNSIYSFSNNPTLITLKYWNECINGEEEKFEEGEEVEVSDDNKMWYKEVYLFINKKGLFVCVSGGYAFCYENRGEYKVKEWKYIRKIKKEEPKEIKLTATDSEIEKLKEFLKENNLDINIE